MRDQARVVVIGGGIVGASALYHLARAGWTDALLVERDELTAGSTWHAAGNCPVFSGSWNIMKMQRYSTELYAGIAEAVDYPIGYHVTGSIRLAQNGDRMDEFRHVVSMARAQGIDFEMLTPAEMKDRHPLLELHDLEGGLWDPHDGDIDPSQATQALAKGARDLGAEIVRGNPVTAIRRRPSGEWEVATREGPVTCEVVVNAAGYRGGEVAAMVGQDLPIVAMQHQYLVTEQIPDLAARHAKLPLLRDPDDSYYLRQERHGLLLGPYEWRATADWLDGIPGDFAYQLYPDDLDRLEWYIERACARVPTLGSVGVQRVINGPIPYAPDGNPLIGPAHGLHNFFHCCAFSFGIVQAGGAGKVLAEWITEGAPEWDMWSVDPRRYTDHATKTYVAAKAVELYQNEYAIGYPFEERPAGRPAKTPPLYALLEARGARFGARGGWERAAWFAAPGDDAGQTLSYHRDRWNWFDRAAAEARAVRERVGIMDVGGFARFEVAGAGAAAWLDGLTCSRLPAPGRVALCYFLAPPGGIVMEATVTRWAEDRFWLVSAAAAEWHDLDWLRPHLAAAGGVAVTNLTAAFSTLVLTGPRARDVLAAVTDAPLDNDAFPWFAARDIEIDYAPVKALRVGYTGELGWELHVPMAYLVSVYRALTAAGEAQGIADFGMYAMESLRLEKAYRSWKQDLITEVTPFEAGLDRFVHMAKGDFLGREGLARQLDAGVPQRLATLVVAAHTADAPYAASVFKDSELVGLVGSAGWGHTVQKSIALAFVKTDLARAGISVEVEILGTRYPATVADGPVYDPANERLKA